MNKSAISDENCKRYVSLLLLQNKKVYRGTILTSPCDVINDVIDTNDIYFHYLDPGEPESEIRIQISWKMTKLKISEKFHHQVAFQTESETET